MLKNNLFNLMKYIVVCSIAIISLEATSACRNVSTDSTEYPQPGITQEIAVNLPFTSVSSPPLYMVNLDAGYNFIIEAKYSISGNVSCDGQVILAQKLEYPMVFSGVMAYGKVPVYNTNLQGLGVSFYNDLNNYAPYTNEVTIIRNFGNVLNGVSFSNTLSLVFNLWSLSNTTHGVFDGSSLPASIVYATDNPSGELDSNAAIIGRFSISGQVIFNSPTCIIEDKEVYLGKHSLSKFTNATTTDWVDASITMNCDKPFSPPNNRVISSTKNGGSSAANSGTSTFFRSSIEAVNGFIDPTRGIMALDSGGATGVAVQISRYERVDNFPASLQWESVSLVKDNNITFVMPLFARYIKTDSTVTAGEANSKLLYTVEYK